MALRISQISILDTFGTQSAKFSPRSVTRITGPNGSGKSSILRALTRIFEGGTDPSVIRQGAEKSIVEIALDDGTIITRTCAPKRRRKPDAPVEYSTSLEILQPDGTPRPAPQTYIASLSEAVAVDPGAILRIDVTTAPGRKQLADVLLRLMPISFAPDDIAGAMQPQYRPDSTVGNFSVSGLALPPIERPLDLDGLRKYVALVTEQRRRIGGTRDDSQGAVSRLLKSLPDDEGRDYSAELATAESYRADVERALSAKRLDIEVQSQDALAVAEHTFRDATDAIDQEIDAKIRELEKQRAERKGAATAVRNAARESIKTATADEIKALADEAQPIVQQSAADIATLKEKLAASQRAASLRQEIEIQRATYADTGRKYDLLSEVLIRIDLLRAEKLKSLPIPDLVVEGDQVLLAGTPWQNVNTAKRVEVSLQLCTLRAGELGVLFLDDAEHLDGETRRMLEEGIAASGFQLIEAIVSDQDELKIETFDSELVETGQ